VSGELVEGSVIKGLAEVAWCGGMPGKGVARCVTYIINIGLLCNCTVNSFLSSNCYHLKICYFFCYSWLRRRWNSSPVVIVGAEDEEYRLTVDDIDSSLVFMYTPVTEEGAKGEPQYAMTDFVKAGGCSLITIFFLICIAVSLFVLSVC